MNYSTLSGSKGKFLTLAYAALLLISAVSCQKGGTGPAGATGPAGPTGATGAIGSANVIYSAWFTPASYTKDTVFGTYGFSYNKADAGITQNILDSGLVITFGKLDGYVTSVWPTAQVEELPINITYMDGASPNIDVWSALLTPGNLKIRLTSSLNAYGSISNAHQFRYVIIPGGQKSTTAAVSPTVRNGKGNTMSTADYNAGVQDVVNHFGQMSYTEICDMLGIPQ